VVTISDGSGKGDVSSLAMTFSTATLCRQIDAALNMEMATGSERAMFFPRSIC
jgi:hypothetical protein